MLAPLLFLGLVSIPANDGLAAPLRVRDAVGLSQETSAARAPAYLVVEDSTSTGISGLALIDKEFERLASTSLGGRLEFALSPSQEKIAAAWIDSEGQSFLQVFGTKDLGPHCAKTPIAHYVTDTTGFWHPILWMGEQALVVEFVTTPRPSPDQGFDSFYAQVFQLPGRPDRPIALHPEHPQRIELPADNTRLLAISDGNAIVLNGALTVRSVNLRTGAASAAIEVRPRGQEGILEAPMGWCAEDDSTLLLFGFDGSVREIQVQPELKVLRKTALPDFSSGSHVAKDAIWKDPFRPDRFLIGTQYLDRTGPVEVIKNGPVEVRASNGLTLIESISRGLEGGFAAGKDGATLTWSHGPPATIRVQGPSGSSEFKFDGVVGAIVPLR
jgi:hypothetical protein